MILPNSRSDIAEDAKLYDPLEWATIALQAPDLGTAWKDVDRRLVAGGVESSAYVFDLPSDCIDFPNPESVAGVLISQEFEEFIRDNPDISAGGATPKSLTAGDTFAPTIVGHPDSDVSNYDRATWEVIESFGFKGGFWGSFHDKKRARASVFMMSSLTSTKDITEAYDNFGAYIHNALVFFNEGMTLRELYENEELPALSPRERECLLWASIGKTTQQIADQLNLTDYTIDEYMSTAMRKLNATSRAHACARSILLSLIAP